MKFQEFCISHTDLRHFLVFKRRTIKKIVPWYGIRILINVRKLRLKRSINNFLRFKLKLEFKMISYDWLKKQLDSGKKPPKQLNFFMIKGCSYSQYKYFKCLILVFVEKINFKQMSISLSILYWNWNFVLFSMTNSHWLFLFSTLISVSLIKMANPNQEIVYKKVCTCFWMPEK